MEIPPFMPGTAELKTTTTNAVQSSQLRTAINTTIYGDAAENFNSRDSLVGKSFEMVSIIRAA